MSHLNDASESTDELCAAVARAFAADGPIARAEPGFTPRPQQDLMAQRVARALGAREALVAEAGTGVGKTFAYLVPLLLAGRRALVSTATKSLQDQLFLRDLPRLRDALGVPVRMALLKGRASYLCRWRLQQAELGAPGAHLPDRFAVRTLNRVSQWAQGTRSGDLAEIEGLDDRSPVIPLVTSTRDNCLGADCPEYRACHVMQARREAMAADLVVVNHHLFFADLTLRDSGVAELLPTVDAAVFDEAHQLAEAGIQFLGTLLATGAALDLGRDILAAGLQHARGLQPWAELQAGIERAARDLRLACAGEQREVRGMLKRRWEECVDGLGPVLDGLADAARAAAEALAAVAETAPEFPKLEQRARSLAALAAHFGQEAESGHVRWVDLTPQQARLVESPLDIREMLTEQRQLSPKAWIFTSATLGDDDELSWFAAGCGLEDAPKLRVGSPFDYAAQARVWVPARMPLPNAQGHAEAVGALAGRLAGALGGRSFVLTTTLRVLPLVAQAIKAQAESQHLTVLVQGSEPRRALLQRFGDGRGCVLVGSACFWEGIDMPGDALQCVVIDKLPFPPPGDPLVEARVKQLREQGRNPFDDYFVAEAAVSLKQGAGRLIRSETDRGLLVLCDPRVAQMRYGRRLLAALPPMARLADEASALAWLAELAAAH